MFETETVASYLTRITQIRDNLVAMGEIIDRKELDKLGLSGFPPKWDVFVDGIVARENMPSWDRFWGDFV